MSATRIDADRGGSIEFTFDGAAIDSFQGETVAAALLAAGVEEFGTTRNGEPRIPLCNMGTCFDCAVTVDGEPLVRACLTEAQSGMVVEKHEGC